MLHVSVCLSREWPAIGDTVLRTKLIFDATSSCMPALAPPIKRQADKKLQFPCTTHSIPEAMSVSASEANVFTISANTATGSAPRGPLSNGTDRMAGFNAQSSVAPGQRLDVSDMSQRGQQFRKLVSDMADHLDKNDVQKIIWQKELPKKMKESSPLNVLEYLYSRGEFTATELRPLSQLLQAIGREDLMGRVESYQEKFGEPSVPRNTS